MPQIHGQSDTVSTNILRYIPDRIEGDLLMADDDAAAAAARQARQRRLRSARRRRMVLMNSEMRLKSLAGQPTDATPQLRKAVSAPPLESSTSRVSEEENHIMAEVKGGEEKVKSNQPPIEGSIPSAIPKQSKRPSAPQPLTSDKKKHSTRPDDTTTTSHTAPSVGSSRSTITARDSPSLTLADLLHKHRPTVLLSIIALLSATWCVVYREPVPAELLVTSWLMVAALRLIHQPPRSRGSDRPRESRLGATESVGEESSLLQQLLGKNRGGLVAALKLLSRFFNVFSEVLLVVDEMNLVVFVWVISTQCSRTALSVFGGG
eukprot:jgi/Bigna1/74655/fgenesh1_pg.30_\